MKKLRRLATQVSHYGVRFVLTDYACMRHRTAIVHTIFINMVWQVNNVVIKAGGSNSDVLIESGGFY